jgi:N-acetylglucosaminyl-diphospho-decaprenol L-rhamnosyltransferase
VKIIQENRIPIILVSYHNQSDVAECLVALSRLTAEPAFDVFICENGGSAAYEALVQSLCEPDGPCKRDRLATVDAGLAVARLRQVCCLRLCGKDAMVTVGEAGENLGYAGGVNAWLRALLACPTWPGVWVLRPDTTPEPSALAELTVVAETRRKGMVGSRIVDVGERATVLTCGSRWRRWMVSTQAVGCSTAATKDCFERVEARLGAPSGASIYVTRRCLASIGLMNEEFFIFFEDLEWGCRAVEACGGIGYAHQSVVSHAGGTTIGTKRSRKMTSAFSVYLDFRNRVNFVRWRYPSWLVWTILVSTARALEYGAVGAVANMTAAFRGLIAGILGQTGRPDHDFELADGTPRFRAVKVSLPRRITKVLRDYAIKRKIKISISLVVYLVAVTHRLLCRAVSRAVPHRLVILYYHGVPSEARFSFARQLDMLSGLTRVVPADFHGTAPAGGHSVAITFDDAFTSVVDNAIPELRSRRMPATIFVPAGCIGGSPMWESEAGVQQDVEKVADADTLRGQMSDLVSFGAHSMTHPHLTRLSEDQARAEVRDCRDQIFRMFGADTRTFAFPYGDFDQNTIALCREAGYQRVFSIIPQVTDPACNEFVRGRVAVDPTDGRIEFYLKMAGAYSWMVHVSRIKAAGLNFLRRLCATRRSSTCDAASGRARSRTSAEFDF